MIAIRQFDEERHNAEEKNTVAAKISAVGVAALVPSTANASPGPYPILP